ncbi:MAG: hypothetical protein Q4G27_08855 [Flavobacteriaceae bacterium]|nr:hypothetical protein [Flavobacteriaceae bacterium]
MKYNFVLFWILFLLFIPVTFIAQEKNINGLIIVDFKSENSEGVWIVNKQTGNYAITDLTGSFRISASVGDTLHLQGSFLQDRKFVVRPTSFDYNPLVIHMNYEVVMLEDLIVKAPLTGDLKKDMNTVAYNDEVERIYANLGIDIRTLDMKPKEKHEPIVGRLGIIPIPTSLNIESLYKTFTGYYRRMENLNQFERLEKRLVDVRDYLGVKFFEETLQIPEEEIHGFLLYAYEHSNQNYEQYYLQKDFLSLDQLLRQKAPEFRQRIKQRDRE